MTARIVTPILVALVLGAAPAPAGAACEQMVAKASAKFVAAALKSMQRCAMLERLGTLPAGTCRAARASGHRPTERALARAEAHLAKGVAPCGDARLATMGFPRACPKATPGDGFSRADLQRCIASTHLAAVHELVRVQIPFPQQDAVCGDGVLNEDEEECDPTAVPTGCEVDEVCDAVDCFCDVIEEPGAVCGNGVLESTEACDPTAVPTGCAEGSTCTPAGSAGQCTCAPISTGPCVGECTPACASGQTCSCECVSQGGQCGDGFLDPGENCDPALPNVCDPGEICLPNGPRACTCGAPPTACGNGLIEWGEACDPAAVPTGCEPGSTCAAFGTPGACTCIPGGVTTTTVPGATTSTTLPGATTTTMPAGGTTTTTLPGAGCCGPERIVLRSSAGTLQVDNLPPFVFPVGVVTTMDTSAAGGAPACQHDVVVPADGFSVPNFDIPALNYCSSVTPLGCEVGTGDGAGQLWDGNGAAGMAMTNVTKTADTSDGVCNPAGQACSTAAGGAGVNTQGDIDSAVQASASSGVRSLIDIPVHSLTWSDATCSPAIAPGCCPGSSYNPADGDLVITEFDFILSPTTDTAAASFADKNGDGCARAGAGFANPTPNSATLAGTPAAGPCCQVGQPTTVVSVGMGFSGGAPLYDLGFKSTIPNTVASCGPAVGGSCTVTTDACLQ